MTVKCRNKEVNYKETLFSFRHDIFDLHWSHLVADHDKNKSHIVTTVRRAFL